MSEEKVRLLQKTQLGTFGEIIEIDNMWTTDGLEFYLKLHRIHQSSRPLVLSAKDFHDLFERLWAIAGEEQTG